MRARFVDRLDAASLTVASNASLAIRLMLEDTHREANPKTPLRDNNLRTAVQKRVDGLKGTITWMMPYASYQERGMRADGSHVVQNYTTPGTGAHFAEDAARKVAGKTAEYIAKVAR